MGGLSHAPKQWPKMVQKSTNYACKNAHYKVHHLSMEGDNSRHTWRRYTWTLNTHVKLWKACKEWCQNMLRIGCEIEGIQGHQREHCSTPIPSKHGMDYATKNRVTMHQNKSQNPLLWQLKWLKHIGMHKSLNMEHETTSLQGIERRTNVST